MAIAVSSDKTETYSRNAPTIPTTKRPARIRMHRVIMSNMLQLEYQSRAACFEPDSTPALAAHPSSAVILRTSVSCSNVRVISTTDFDFDTGHFANAAQSRNFIATSSNEIGIAGLPLAKSARPLMTR